MKRILFALLACLPLTGQAAIQYFMGSPGQVFMVGLSSDTKPAAGNASVNGAVFLESDTDKVFLRVAGAWVEQDNTAYQNASAELDNLTSNCVVGNDSTPIPDSCVGDGADDGGAGGVDTANSPNANEFARFTDADTIEGRTAAEAKADLDLEIGTDLAPSNLDYLVGTASGNLSAEIAVGTTPGGELGNTWASPSLDDSVTVTGWIMGASTADTASANDSDTSLGTTAFVQGEIDDGDNLTDNCALEADATPIPDSCVGNGSDADTLGADGDKGEVTVGGTGTTLAIDDGTTVDAWVLGASTATSPGANDNDTSLATSAFVQSELDDVDLVGDNCTLENDATPIPDSCVGDGSDAGAGGGAPTTVDYLVGTADGTLSNEIVVGTTPGGELGNTWASPTLDDSIGVTDWTLTSPNYAAGSTTASSWPNYTAGTVLTTAEDGALELDADALYFATDAGNRGVVPVEHVIRAASDQTLTSVDTPQNIFDVPSNGRITLETGAYIFEALIQITSMSGTSGNGQILFGGTGTFGGWNWKACGIDATAPTGIVADLCAYFLTNASAASVVSAVNGTALRLEIRGSFECSVAGTLIPQIDLVTAAAGVVEEGSYFVVRRVGATTATSIGQWD